MRGKKSKTVMSVMTCIFMGLCLAVGAQITAITPDQAYRGDSLYTTITSSGMFLVGSSPQNNIVALILKNATDSVFAVSDSTSAVNTNTAKAFWNIPAGIATGLYTLVVRIYNTLFSGPTTDYTLTNSFNITTPVWPGDADNDHVVDNNDLLAIGLGYGSAGPARLSVSAAWQAWSSIDWTDSFSGFAGTVNDKFADCNGDGVINAADTTAIIQNFSLTHAKNSSPGDWRSGLPALIPVVIPDTVYNGSIYTVTFVLGDSLSPANNIYGVAFTYNYDPSVVDSNFTSTTLGNSWLGTSTDKISISKTFGHLGQIKMALTRIDHTTRGGSGPIGSTAFKITTDNISGSINAQHLNTGFISDVTIIDSAGNIIPVNAGADTNVIWVWPEGINYVSGTAMRLAPNPAESIVTLSADDIFSEINIVSTNGQQVWHHDHLRTKVLPVDVSALEDGLYLVQVRTAKGVNTMKLIVAK